MGRPMKGVFSIGHSNHAIESFVALLERNCVEAVADVRSQPMSRRFPQFDRAALQASLERAGIRYVFLGDGLGARPRDPDCYTGGRADFARIRSSAPFAEAIQRLRRGAESYNVCLMCAERDPAACHRTWLVSEALRESGLLVTHIFADGSTEAHEALLRRISGSDTSNGSLFGDEAEILAATARREGERVAYRVGTKADEEEGE